MLDAAITEDLSGASPKSMQQATFANAAPIPEGSHHPVLRSPCGAVSPGCLTTTDNHGIMANGVAYAEPPWVVPSAILDGGKGTSVSGHCPGPFVVGRDRWGISTVMWKAR